MECKACGHKHVNFDTETFEVTHTDTEEFISINGNFSVRRDYGHLQEVYLYACPECGAVIMGN